MKYSLDGKEVELRGEGHFIAPNAAVIGDVTLEENVSVWFSVVIRGDAEHIHIGAGSNIQDGAVCHADPGVPLTVGENVTVGHNAMIHGCTIGDGTLVGINAVILNNAKIGKNCVIGANSLVPDGMQVPDGSMVMGTPARVKKELTEEQQELFSRNAAHYIVNGHRYRSGLKEQP
jgi:carbonic anhydrase/acetyltransferase-like protein (isoleucine patch superfamily)